MRVTGCLAGLTMTTVFPIGVIGCNLDVYCAGGECMLYFGKQERERDREKDMIVAY
jgi:hypothetical protein